MSLRIAIVVLLGSLLLAVSAAVGAGYWLLYTAAGTAWSIGQVERFSDQAVGTMGVRGSWAGGMTIDQLAYNDSQRALVLSDVRLQLNLARLLRRELYVELLDIEQLELSLSPAAPEEPTPASGPTVLPVEIVLVRGRVGRLSIDGDADNVIEDIQVSANWRSRRIAVAQFSGAGRGVQLDGSGALLLEDPLGLSGEFSWTAAPGDGAQLVGRAVVDGTLESLQITHDLLAPYAVSTTGHIELGDTPSVDLVTTSDQVEYRLGEKTYRLTGPRLTLTGWLDRYRATWEGDLSAEQLPSARLRGAGSGDLGSLQLDSFTLGFERGRIDVTGQLGWAEAAQGQLDVSLTELDPSQLLSEWPGSLTGRFVITARQSPGGLAFDVRDIGMAGELRGQPVDLRGRVTGDGGQLSFEAVRIASGRNYVSLQGTYGNRFALTYDLDVTDLSLLGEDWGGTISAAGTIGGTLAAPELQIQASAGGLRSPWAAVQALELDGGVTGSQQRSDLRLNASGVQFGARHLDSIQMLARGLPGDHEIDVNAAAGADVLSVTLAGGWSAEQWQGELVTSAMESGQWGSWRQVAAAELRLSPQQAQADRLCWSDGEARLCVQGSAGSAQLELVGRLENVSLKPLARFLPEGVSVTGAVSGDLEVKGSPQAPELSFTANAPSVDLLYSFAPDEDAVETSLRDLAIQGAADAAQITFDVQLAGAKGSDLAFNGRLAGWRAADRELDARLRARIPDVAFLSMLYTEVSDWGGSVDADLAVAGPLLAPQVNGFLRLTDGRALVRRAGISVEDIQLEVQPTGGNRLGIKGRARSGAGQLLLDGGVELDGDAGWPLYGKLSGNQFTAIRVPGIELTISPDVAISGARNTIRLSGQVTAPRAVVELKELPEQAIKVSPDVVVHGAEQEAPETQAPLQFYTDLNLILGEEVRFSGFGLRTDLAGQLALKSAPQLPMEGRGIVNITKGRFQAYGQNLEIQDGTLLFDGPLDDPSLDVEAVRRLDGVKVGVRVRGSGRSPQATVFSDPAMSEADALSYLVIGRPLAQATNAEGASLTNAAVALGLKQAMPITDQIGQAVGLDELGLDPDNVDTGAVMAGKQITPDLYVRYSYGLFSRLGALLLRYRLNSRLSLEARSSEDQSMDVIYTRERK